MEAVISIQTPHAIIPITGAGTIRLDKTSNIDDPHECKVHFCGHGFSTDIFRGTIKKGEGILNEIGKAIESGQKVYIVPVS